MDIPQCLQNIRPGEQWKLDGATYDGLTWLEPTVKPTIEEIEAAFPIVENNNNIYKQIDLIESSITARRQREAILGIDNGWMANAELQIVNLRKMLL